ncbi:hypothetical protein KM043_006087 [Ampulex compressa]|nr:hypothetical protein KM043_006087 [Ampulex compressa]
MARGCDLRENEEREAASVDVSLPDRRKRRTGQRIALAARSADGSRGARKKSGRARVSRSGGRKARAGGAGGLGREGNRRERQVARKEEGTVPSGNSPARKARGSDRGHASPVAPASALERHRVELVGGRPRARAAPRPRQRQPFDAPPTASPYQPLPSIVYTASLRLAQLVPTPVSAFTGPPPPFARSILRDI